MDDRLAAQLEFLLEADRLKQIERQSLITGSRRRENTAEHSWHLALFALVLSEHADEDIDLARVVAMVVPPDLVDLDAGDTYA
jgi:putative hydrolase of HD superfamily